ncbi:MAG TPA: hypothetical protein VMB80_13410 [Candidatus Acidoferrum sp.]|nr:hypothetical protein [Candidatus Acidoferrum sp.]
MAKRAFKALAVLLGLAAILYVEENWRGKRAWNAYRHELEARGEHLDFDYYIPAPVPDDQNFALTPIVASCYSQYLDRNGHRIEPPDTNVADRLKMDIMRNGIFQPVYPDSKATAATNGSTLSVTNPPYYYGPHIGRWQQAELTDLKAWQFYYRLPQDTNSPYFPKTNEFPTAVQPQSPAADVLLALSRYDSAIEDLRQASRLPFSRFPLNYVTNNPARIISPHFEHLKRCASVLRLRAVAELDNGEPAKALEDVQLVLRLAGSIHNEPNQWAASLRMFITDTALQPIWEGLARQQWSDDQLVALQQELAHFDALKDYEFAMRSELAMQLKIIEYLRSERMANRMTDWNDDTMWVPTMIYRLLPNGWFYLNARVVARAFEAALPTGAELEQRILSPQISKRFGQVQAQAYRRQYLPDYFLLCTGIPPLDREAINCACMQAAVDMARIACALERYRHARGSYPEQLDALVPQFIEKLPHDIINGQPLHYRRTENGRFLLYSVGWNGKDDGGVVDTRIQLLFSKPEGDWVWQYPAKD